jgi:hypothetical protein
MAKKERLPTNAIVASGPKIHITPEIFDTIETNQQDGVTRIIPKTFHAAMQVPVIFYLNNALYAHLREEVACAMELGESGFLPSLTQLINVACMPGLVHVR